MPWFGYQPFRGVAIITTYHGHYYSMHGVRLPPTNPQFHRFTGTSVHMQGHTWSELEMNQQPYPRRYCQVGRRASYESQTSWPVYLHGLSEACRSC